MVELWTLYCEYFGEIKDNVTTGPVCALNLRFRLCAHCGGEDNLFFHHIGKSILFRCSLYMEWGPQYSNTYIYVKIIWYNRRYDINMHIYFFLYLEMKVSFCFKITHILEVWCICWAMYVEDLHLVTRPDWLIPAEKLCSRKIIWTHGQHPNGLARISLPRVARFMMVCYHVSFVRVFD